MATTVDSIGNASGVGRGWASDQPYFTRYAMLLTALILFGFIQFELRGFVDIRTAPLFLHVHGAVMVSWLGLFVLQNVLIQSRQIALHRTLGWLSVAVAAAVVVVCSYTGITATKMRIVPPFFIPAQFLALTQVGAATFGILVAWAIARRKDTQFHRRLMLGSLILITEPAFGRLLPMPLLGGEMGEWAIMLIQLGFVFLIARHDRKVLGTVHEATKIVLAAVVLSHVVISALSNLPAFSAYAQAVAAG